MSRGFVSRIQKLESRRRNEGEILLLWRLPGQDVATAAKAARSAGLFVSGDRVVSAAWLGNDQMPAPRWVQVKPSGFLSLNDREKEYCVAAVRSLVVSDGHCAHPDPALEAWTEADLWHGALGVPT